MIILPFIPIAALIVQNCCTMVNVAIANRDATEINKQVNVRVRRHRKRKNVKLELRLLKYRSVFIGDKVKFALEEAMKAQRESRGIALLFL
jgi:hypothetical protein